MSERIRGIYECCMRCGGLASVDIGIERETFKVVTCEECGLGLDIHLPSGEISYWEDGEGHPQRGFVCDVPLGCLLVFDKEL